MEPKIGESVFIAPNAVIVGDVELKDNSSVWFNAVLRGDLNSIKVGEYTSIQDNAVLHVDVHTPIKIGKCCTIGHSVVLHGCEIGDNVVVGLNSSVLDGAVIGEYSVVGANSLVTSKEYPPNSLIIGVPAKVVRELSNKEIELIERSWKEYHKMAKKYKEVFKDYPIIAKI
ncbi:gamma carbonic anhydrase family protein [Archaeoglobales archaeon]|nr:MAG: gamma carbonic anhydrase family protein [Archaeoglobales archaeon]